MGAYFLERLHGLQEQHASVSNARGRGVFLAMDLADGATRDRLRQACFDRGLATLSCGSRSLRFRPPLVFSRQDVDRACEILQDVLGAL